MVTKNKQTRLTERRMRRQSPVSWKLYSMAGLCGMIFIAGFFFAARQHFSTMDYAMRNSQLRKQIETLEAEKRRMLLNREVALSPAELMKNAKRIGITQFAAPESPAPAVAQTVAYKAPTVTPVAPMVQRTASVKEVVQQPTTVNAGKTIRVASAAKTEPVKASKPQPAKTSTPAKPVKTQAKNTADNNIKKNRG